MHLTAPLRVLLVGAGSTGSLHARVLSRSEACELEAVVDPDEAVGRALADRHERPWYPELGGLLDRHIDAVVLAAPTRHRHRLALEILDAGKPLLIEKPVCDGLAATREVLDAAEKNDVPLLCALPERYNPAVLTGFALLRDPVHITAVRHSPYAPRVRTGVAWDLLLQDVDLVVRAFGGTAPILAKGSVGRFHPVSANDTNDTNDTEDVAEAVLTFPGGGLGTVAASRLGARKVRSIVVAEFDRLIELDLLLRDVTIYRHVSHESASADRRGHHRQTVIEIPEPVTATEPLVAQLEHFAALVRGQADAVAERATILPAHQIVDQVLRRPADEDGAREPSSAAVPAPSGALDRASAVADFTGALR